MSADPPRYVCYLTNKELALLIYCYLKPMSVKELAITTGETSDRIRTRIARLKAKGAIVCTLS